jgi:cytoskeleton protein RodZ
LVDVENVTKIRSKYLEALEENDFEVLPGSTVVKGFLRSYAVFLKIDPELLLYEYRSLYESRKEEIGAALRTDMAQQRRTPTSAERKKKRVRKTQRGYVAAALVAIAIIIVIAYFGAKAGGNGPAVLGTGNLPTTVSSLPSTTVAVDSTSTSDTVAKSTTTTERSTGTTTGRDVTMVLTVTRDSCWLVVREDSENGRDMYAGALAAGGQQSFTTAKQYWVRAGAPQNLSVSVNGNLHTLDGEAGVFIVTETGIEREQTDSTTTTK